MAKGVYDGNPESFDHLIKEGYEFDLSRYLNEGWNIFRSYGWGFFIFAIVAMFTGILVGQIPFFGGFAQVALAGIFTAGMYMVARRIDHGLEVEFGDFFKGFDDSRQIALAKIVMALIMGLLMSVLGGAAAGYGFLSGAFDGMISSLNHIDSPFELIGIFTSPHIILILLAVLVGAMVVSVIYQFTIPFISFGRLSFWPAMETSRKVIMKHFWNFFLLSLIFGAISILGLMVFGVGIFAAQGIATCVMYAAFKDIAMEGEIRIPEEEHVEGESPEDGNGEG